MADIAATNPTDSDTFRPLSKIPVEVLLRITHFITTRDLGNMRLTCKAIERSLFHFFSHEFFQKKQFMAYTISLQALLDISKHPELAPSLKHVIICTDRYEESAFVNAHRGTVENQLALNQARDDHNNLMSTGLLRDYLAEAFANLPNLETIDFRDFNSPTRNRDSTNNARAFWSSYGVTTLQNQIGLRPNVDGGYERNQSQTYRVQLFHGVMSALAVANARPKALEVVLRSQGLTDSAFFIHPRLEPSISQVLSGLKKLHLVLQPPRAIQHLSPWDMTNVKKFLRLSPNVTWLRINLSNDRHPSDAQIDEAGNLLYWITGTKSDGVTPLDDPAEAPSFQLETLDLGFLTTRPEHLTRLIAHFAKTLQNISIRRAVLRSKPDEDKDQINLWAKVLRGFARTPHLELRKISMAWLRQGSINIDLASGAERTWKGESTGKVVDQAVRDIKPLWPAPSPDPDHDMDDG